MTSDIIESPPPAPSRRGGYASPLRIAGALAQLAALGLAGPVVLAGMLALLSGGLALVLVAGVGFIALLALIYALWLLAWLETARIEGLYGYDIPPPALCQPAKPGFWGVIAMFGRQAIDPAQWRALASVTVASLLGLVTLALFAALGSGVALAFSPLYARGGMLSVGGIDLDIAAAWAPAVGIAVAVVSIAVLVGVALLHGLLATVILVPSREAQLVAVAQASATQRAGAVRAADVERTRIERDLHDGVQPRLVSVAMTLGLARQKIDDDPGAAKALIEEAHTSTKSAITELRQLARGIHASVLDDRGLDAALSALAARSHVPVHLDVRIDGRCERGAEAAVYFAIAESLTNAAKHSRAGGVRVVVRRRTDGALWARVEDDGIGGARILAGGGLDGISNRIVGAGGTYRLDSPHGGPTALEVSVPCAS